MAEWIAFSERDAAVTDCPHGFLLLYHVYRGVVVEPYDERRATAMYTHWARLPDYGWIETSETRPGADDADYRGCVLGWHRYDGFVLRGWRRFGEDRYLERWMPVPPGPVATDCDL